MNKSKKQIMYLVGGSIAAFLGYSYLKSGWGLSKLSASVTSFYPNGIDVLSYSIPFCFELAIKNPASYDVTVNNFFSTVKTTDGDLVATIDKEVQTICKSRSTTKVCVEVAFDVKKVYKLLKPLLGGDSQMLCLDGSITVNGNVFPFELVKSVSLSEYKELLKSLKSLLSLVGINL